MPKPGGIHKKPSWTGEVKPVVLKLGATLHVQMTRATVFTGLMIPRLFYKNINIFYF